MENLINYAQLTQFLLISYAVGWVLVARLAIKERRVDLCQLVKLFTFSPFVTTCILALICFLIIPMFLTITVFVFGSIAVCFAMGFLGKFVLSPAIKKAYGAAKPFSDKICVVLYRK